MLIAGGPHRDEQELFQMVEDALGAGASGVSIGRTVFGSAHPHKIARQLVRMVHNGISADEIVQEQSKLTKTI